MVWYLSGAIFLAMLDLFIVAMALPSIGEDLGATGSGLQSVIALYALAYASVLVAAARLGDRFGAKTVMLVGVALFLLASAMCALASSVPALLVGRLLQGLGAAGMVPQIVVIFRTTLDESDRVKAMGLYGAMIGVGSITGQLVGGLLLDWDLFGLGWRSAFLVNLPLGAVVLWGVARHVPHRRLDAPARFDAKGAALLAICIAGFTTPALLGHEYRWSPWLLSFLVFGLLALSAMRAHLRRPRPGWGRLIEPSVLAVPRVRRSLFTLVLLQSSMAVLMFTVPLAFDRGLAASPLQIGLLLFIPAAVFVIVSAMLPKLPAGARARGGAIGLAAFGLGVAALSGTMNLWDTPPLWAAIPGLFAVGVGYGLGFSPSLDAAVAAVSDLFAGTVSGVVATGLQAANVLGVSLGGGLFLTLQGGDSAMTTLAAFARTGFAVAVLLVAAALWSSRNTADGRPADAAVAGVATGG